MSRSVLKWPLALRSGPQTIVMPDGFVLHVHEQNGLPTLWVEHLKGAKVVDRTFHVLATGEPIPDRSDYIGTVHIDWTVWHVYEDGVRF